MRAEDEEIQEAIERARRIAEREKRSPWGKGKRGPRSFGRVKVYARKSTPHVLEFMFSFDMIERMWQLQNRHPDTARLPKRLWGRLRLRYVTFIETAMPACLIKIDDFFYPVGPKIRKVTNGWRFTCAIDARKIGVREGVPSQELDYFWWPREDEFRGGIVAIFPDEHMIYEGEKLDVKLEFGLDNREDEDED